MCLTYRARDVDFVSEGQRSKGRRKTTWKKQVKDENIKVGLGREYVLCPSEWIVGVNEIGNRLR